MTLVTDHTFHIGQQHLLTGKPCQDFALSGNLSDSLAYAIISDGCSSGGMTDIGARLMVLATRRAIVEQTTMHETGVFGDTIIKIAALRDHYLERYCAELCLKSADLLATCLFVIATPTYAIGHIVGDGTVAAVYKNLIYVEHFSWDKNTPYYPIYRVSGQDDCFQNKHQDTEKPFVRQSNTIYLPKGNSIAFNPSRHTATEGMQGCRVAYGPTGLYWRPEELLAVALFTDGLEQIDGTAANEAVKQLTAWKSTQGQFAVRRMNRFLTEAKALGKGPQDDIAQAVIHLGLQAR